MSFPAPPQKHLPKHRYLSMHRPYQQVPHGENPPSNHLGRAFRSPCFLPTSKKPYCFSFKVTTKALHSARSFTLPLHDKGCEITHSKRFFNPRTNDRCKKVIFASSIKRPCPDPSSGTACKKYKPNTGLPVQHPRPYQHKGPKK